MKYLYYILLIILATSLYSAYRLFEKDSGHADAAIIINDRTFTVPEFNAMFAARPPHVKTRKEFIDNLITRELFIQEAQKRGIDKEESFRKSVQNFYEQSLTKILIDRQLASLTPSVSREEIDRYKSMAGTMIHLTVTSYATLHDAEAQTGGRKETVISPFDDLAAETKLALLMLQAGATSAPHKMDGRYIRYRLDAIEKQPGPHSAPPDGQIITLLENTKKNNELSAWVEQLKDRAAISILLPAAEEP